MKKTTFFFVNKFLPRSENNSFPYIRRIRFVTDALVNILLSKRIHRVHFEGYNTDITSFMPAKPIKSMSSGIRRYKTGLET